MEKQDFGDRRVLLVEDNDLNREIAQSLLEMHGIQTDTAENLSLIHIYATFWAIWSRDVW